MDEKDEKVLKKDDTIEEALKCCHAVPARDRDKRVQRTCSATEEGRRYRQTT